MSSKAWDMEKLAEGSATPRQKWNRKRTLLYAVGFVLGFGFLSFRGRLCERREDRKSTSTKPSMDTGEKERLFLSVPNGQSALATAKMLASHPHAAGTPQDFVDAVNMLQIFQQELGIRPPLSEPIFSAGTPKSRSATISLTELFGPRSPTAWIDTYYPEMDHPLGRSLDLLNDQGESIWSVDLDEDGDPMDELAFEYRTSVPAWHGCSGDGVAEGELIYVGYGTKAEYDELFEAGTNFTGKVVLARSGENHLGLKVKRAEELGAAGVLIYNDPRDDGHVTVQNGYAPYPHGPARNPTSIQRGSLADASLYPGDPTTPGYPAYERADRQEPLNIRAIPSLPISWQNAQRLLGQIGDLYVDGVGPVKNEGRLSGQSSKAKVRLVNHVERKITPIWNTMAAIPGHIREEVVVIGGHRDAWVLGAVDPVSGSASLVEVVRGFGELLRNGWKPLRTILIANWDGEESALIGSTEYGEDFASWLSEHAVAYINVDSSCAGSQLKAYGSPSLAHLMKQTALDVPHPVVQGKTLWDARDDHGPFVDNLNGTSKADNEHNDVSWYQKRGADARKFATDVGPLGSGSDFSVFLQRLGIPSTHEEFTNSPSDAVYHEHSIYDTIRWLQLFVEGSGYHRHVAIARHLGLIVLRLADSIIIPLNTTQYTLELNDYTDEVEKLASDNAFKSLDFSPLRESIKLLHAMSVALDHEKQDAEVKFKEALSKLPEFPWFQQTCHTRRGRWVWKSLFEIGYASPPYCLPHEEETIWDHLDYINESQGESENEEDLLLSIPNPIFNFIKAARRVSKVNRKLRGFERGFISEEGIKNREWYRNLAVAPAKWLGYGATTFPALSEAITIEKDVELAKHEIWRLEHLLDKLALDIMV